jgi:putative salt-induced outer membrane protein YdiY
VASITTSRKDPVHEWAFGLEGSYGEDHGVKNNESVKGYGQYNYLISERFYLFARADALYDAIADIDYRVTVSAGPGYYFIKNAQTRLSGEVGPGVVFEKIGGQSDTYATIRFGERFEHKFNDKTRVWQSAEFLPRLDDWDDYVVNAEVGLDTLLSGKLSLRPYLQDTYRSRPAPNRKHNDLKLVVAVAYKF